MKLKTHMSTRIKVVDHITYRVETRPASDDAASSLYWLGDDGSTLGLTVAELVELSA